MANISPMMSQYMEIKKKYKDTIVFFRLGDFYEMFFDDAKLVSQELDLTLTGRDYGQKDRAPMCGIPYHSCESYIARLISKGYKIAMCDQMELPSQSKGIVKREVTRVITPGTVMEESMLDESKNNYICSISFFKKFDFIGVSFCDVSTGELRATEIHDDLNNNLSNLKNELGKFCPTEILISGDLDAVDSIKDFIANKLNCRYEVIDNVDLKKSESTLLERFNVDSLKKLKIEDNISIIYSLGNLFEYLKYTQKNDLERISKLKVYTSSDYMGIDLNTIRNLEIKETMRTKSKKGSLLWVIDKTKTAMGKRMLRSWIDRPLVDKRKIELRQDAVEEFVDETILRNNLSDELSEVRDIERLMTKVSYGSANARDLRAIAYTISKFPEIKFNLFKFKSEMIRILCERFDLLKEVFMVIDDAIVDEPPLLLKDGGIIKPGYSEELDKIRGDMNCGKDVVANIETRERQKNNIPKLKVGYNRVFGYYIEVPNSFKNRVPQDYIRKQTLANCERYVTQELKDLESRILYAKDKIYDIEYKLFEDVRKKVASNMSRIINSANIVAAIDTLISFAEVAASNNYTKPCVTEDDSIYIKNGRHPVVEMIMQDAPFVPNDTILDNSKNMVSIITGPNMAGKSTYMRQTALIVLLAQIGSFVPASEAKIGIVDNIFTRIGASDDLASGQSTFMIEMNEVSDILKNATSKSLLILDEIGRGTSTFDGMSIAKAVLEYVADPKLLGAKTLFATHYHELTDMVKETDYVKNYNIAVKKSGDDITFLRRIVPGAADESYGIEVAKLAGIPDEVISRAKEILKEIETKEENSTINEGKKKVEIQEVRGSNYDVTVQKIVDNLKNMDVSVLTPIESMNKLYELAKLGEELKKAEEQ